GRRADQREIDRSAERRQRSECRSIENGGVIRVDREEIALESAGKQVLVDDAPERSGLGRGADQRDRLGCKQRPKVMAGRYHAASLLHMPRMLQCVKPGRGWRTLQNSMEHQLVTRCAALRPTDRFYKSLDNYCLGNYHSSHGHSFRGRASRLQRDDFRSEDRFWSPAKPGQDGTDGGAGTGASARSTPRVAT